MGCSMPDIDGEGALDGDGCGIGRADDGGDAAQRGLGASDERSNGCSIVGNGGGVIAIQTCHSGRCCHGLRHRGHIGLDAVAVAC